MNKSGPSCNRNEELQLSLTECSRPSNKREEFRRYLEKSGVMNSLTKAISSFNKLQNQPENLVEYFANQMSEQLEESSIKKTSSLRQEEEELQQRLNKLGEDNTTLKDKIDQIKKPKAPSSDIIIERSGMEGETEEGELEKQEKFE